MGSEVENQTVKKRTGLYVVIPALNEGTTIAKVVEEMSKAAEKVIVVNDGSTDQTAEVARSAGAIVLDHPKPKGYDAAISAGLNLAFEKGAQVATTCDADGQHRLEDVIKVSDEVLSERAEYAAGVRDHYNRAIEGILGIVSKSVFGTPDPFCGLRAYGKSVYLKLGAFPAEMNIGTLTMVRVKKQNLECRFIPIHVQKRADQPRFGKTVKASWILFRAFSRSMLDYVQ